MRVGRNDPCPCGSGKKYKKCCLEKDRKGQAKAPPPPPKPPGEYASDRPFPKPVPRAARRGRVKASVAAGSQAGGPGAREVDPFWQEFEGRDYEGQIALFEEALDGEEEMESELAFEMLAAIRESAMERGDRERLGGLVAALQSRRPDTYASDAPY
jgi:hypothetical protein